MTGDARRGRAKPPLPPEPTSQGDGQGTTESLATTMPSGVAGPDPSGVPANAPLRATAGAAATARGPVNRITAVWRGGQRFDTGREGGPTARLDGTNETGQSPVDALLSALATCCAVDVVEILAKRRTPVEQCRIDVTATRRVQTPRRVLTFEIDYRIDGAGIEREHAERAIHLALEKYCTVAATLKPDTVIVTRLTLNGELGEAHRRPVPE